jgi:hypothetical protein
MLKVKTLSKIAFSVVLLGVTMMSTSGQALEVKGSDDIQMEIQKTLEYTEQQKDLLDYANKVAKKKSKIELFNVDGVDGVVVLNSTDKGTEVIVKANEEIDIKAEAIILTEKQESILDYENPWNEAYNSVETPDKKSLIVESFKSEFSVPEYYSGRRARVTVERNRKQKIIDLKILEKEYTNAEESQM